MKKRKEHRQKAGRKARKAKKGGERESVRIINIITRYAIAFLLSLNSLFIFYYVFKPLTFYPSVFLLKLFYSVQLTGLDKIVVNSFEISFVNACIAGSAYYLLALLNLATPGIKWLNRIKIFFVNSIFLLLFNILRIVILAVMLVNSSAFFDATHFILWHFISIIFVAFIWIFTVRLYKIKAIPVWSDLVYLKGLIKGK